MATKKKVASTNRISGNGASIAPVAKKIYIEPLNVGVVDVTVRGMSLLCVNAFPQKAMQEMLEKQMKSTKAKQAKEARCPEREFLDSMHWVRGDKPEGTFDKESRSWSFDAKVVAKAVKEAAFGIPLTAFKNALISACRSTDFKMTEMKQIVFVHGYDSPDFAIIESKEPPSMREDMVRIDGGRTAMVRFRGCWEKWSTKLRISFNASMISEGQVFNLLNLAGYSVGVCEGRPERSALGWGRFTVVDE